MVLRYDFVRRFYGIDEKHDEVIADYDTFEYDADYDSDDVYDYMCSLTDKKIDKETFKFIYDNWLYDTIEEDEDFIDYLKGLYYQEAYDMYREED